MKKDWLKMANDKLSEIPFDKDRSFAQMAAYYQGSYSHWSTKALLALARYVIPFAKKYWGQEWNLYQAIGQIRYGLYPYEARTPRLVRFFESWEDYRNYCYYREICRQLEISKEPPKKNQFFGIEKLFNEYDYSWMNECNRPVIWRKSDLSEAQKQTEELVFRPIGLSLLKEAFGYVGYEGARLKFDDDADKAGE